jgi:glycolate oxidase FAD binding subunit
MLRFRHDRPADAAITPGFVTMTAGPLDRLVDVARVDPRPGMPGGAIVVAPPSIETAASLLEAASVSGSNVRFWGGGTHQGFGYPAAADLIMSTERLARIVDWQADDLTIVVEAGLPVAELESLLATRNQSAVLPEFPGAATVGGVVAAGVSGYRRLRYGPTRDRMLQSVIVTGDGRVTTAGGRVVKNVTGYDIPRLATGSFGSLGLIAQVCLKLWPMPTMVATITVDDAAIAAATAYRPLAVLETPDRAAVYAAGTEEEISALERDLNGTRAVGLDWPLLPTGAWTAIARVPPASVPDLADRLRGLGLSFVAAHGVGEVHVAAADVTSFGKLRSWAEARGGAFVVTGRPVGADGFDPWGTPPPSIDLQRRVKAAFDPAGIANPGILPGRL